MLKWGLPGRGSNLLKCGRPLTSRTPGCRIFSCFSCSWTNNLSVNLPLFSSRKWPLLPYNCPKNPLRGYMELSLDCAARSILIYQKTHLIVAPIQSRTQLSHHLTSVHFIFFVKFQLEVAMVHGGHCADRSLIFSVAANADEAGNVRQARRGRLSLAPPAHTPRLCTPTASRVACLGTATTRSPCPPRSLRPCTHRCSHSHDSRAGSSAGCVRDPLRGPCCRCVATPHERVVRPSGGPTARTHTRAPPAT